ncbi:hypothetical protein BDZ91DRAFT_789611 [Kalaharituber pfeilii]|nr:hypothetical protein BDZ91DRAFT_789611 [Kalaharituber pfeilii]
MQAHTKCAYTTQAASDMRADAVLDRNYLIARLRQLEGQKNVNDCHIDLDSDSNNSPESSVDGPNQSTPTDRLTTNILEVKGGGSTTSGKGGKRQARGQGSGKRGRTRAAKDTDNKIVVKSTALSGATDSQPPPPPPSTLEKIIQQMQQLQQLVSGLANRAER